MLHQRFSPADVAAALVPRSTFHPWPRIDDRSAWESLVPAAASAQVARAERLAAKPVDPLPATLFLEFAREGNRVHYERVHFERRGIVEALVAAECIEDHGRFLDRIVDGVWAICEETYWGIPAHVSAQRIGVGLPDVSEPTVDLFAAETANLLAWTFELLSERLDLVSPLVRERIQRETDRRVLEPLRERDDFWWMGFRHDPAHSKVNNWNPWICSNWLSAILLLEIGEETRAASVAKLMRTLDNFIDTYPSDGGCDEGPSYWGRAGASLYDTLDLLSRATDRVVDVFDEPLIAEIGRFIYRAHIADDYAINFADAPAIVYPDPALVCAYGEHIGDPTMAAHGRWLARRAGIAEQGPRAGDRTLVVNFQRLLRSLFSIPQLSADPAEPALLRDVWLPDIQVMVARDRAGSTDGFFTAAKGGHNGESHNHNDVGSFVVYLDGCPLVVDAGVETYTAKTFGAHRYEIWTMQSAYHSLLPTVNGIQQAAGAEYAARMVEYRVDDATARLSLDLAGAYPREASLEEWRRTLTLERGRRVVVTDRVRIATASPKIQTALVTPCTVTLLGGTVELAERDLPDGRRTAAGTIVYDDAVYEARVETIPISDERLTPVWGTDLFRIVFSSINGTSANGISEFVIER